MNKTAINTFFRRFGFELHGIGFIQSLKKPSFKEDAFITQREILGEHIKVVFDIGANVGDISIRYNQLFKNADIYAFEPFPETFTTLKKNLSLINKVQVFKLAMGAKNGIKKFYVNYNADTNSLLQSKNIGLSSDKQVATKSEIEVEVITIDDFCSANNINEIDILKLDIQGGELDALKGAEHMLASNKIKLIYTEAYFKQQYVDQPLLIDIAKYLEQFGYSIQDIYNPIYGKGSLAWCDAIFLSK